MAPITDEADGMSPAQHRFWFLDQTDPGSPQYNSCTAVTLSGPLEHRIAAWSVNELVRRHPVLRSRFPAEVGGPVLRVAPALDVPMPFLDLSGLDERVAGIELDRLATAVATRSLDIQQGPILRTALVRTSDADHTLLINVHHIASDGWSTGVIVRDFLAIYTARRDGSGSAPGGAEPHYAAVSARQEEWRELDGEYERQRRYWLDRLDGKPGIGAGLPHDRPRRHASDRPASVRRVRVTPELTEAARAFGRERRATMFMVLLTAFVVAVARSSDRTDLSVGTLTALREDPDTHDLIGPFINTLVLDTDLSGNPTLDEALTRVRATCLGAYDHQDIPFEDVVAALRVDRNSGVTPLVQTMFQHIPAPAEPLGAPGIVVRVAEVEAGIAKFDLTVDVLESDGGLDVVAHYDTALFDAATIDNLLRRCQAVLATLITAPRRRIEAIDLMTEAERVEILGVSVGPALDAAALAAVVAGRPATSLLDLVEAHADRTPDALAVISGSTRVTYAGLDREANRLAHRLLEHGLRREHPVGILMERSAETVIAVLAVWKAGGAFLPLDLDSPAARRQLILTDAGVELLVTQEQFTCELADLAVGVITMDDTLTGSGPFPRSRPDRTIAPDDLCYVIYTSGSSGQPKGVMATHGGLLRMFLGWEHAFRLSAETTAHTQMANFCFDGYLGELARGLGSGSTMVVCPRETLLDPQQLLQLIRGEGVDYADFVPTVLRSLVDHVSSTGQRLDFLRLIVVGSDTFPVDELGRIQQLGGARTQVVNCYGLTEATIDSTFYLAAAEPTTDLSVLIGTPFAGTSAYVLDDALQPVPPGVAGRLCIAGPSLTRGYLGNGRLTASVFRPHPLSHRPGERIYDTGDRARYVRTPRGLQLEYLGRRDQQVKIRGYRVELGEIEATFRSVPAVRDVVVIVEGTDPTQRRLHAYIVPDPEAADVNWHAVLRRHLPLYMMPERLVLVEALPTTATGKLDRNGVTGLHGIEIPRPATHSPARNATELRLLELWSELLECPTIGIYDDFFMNGGNSLLAMQTIADIREKWGVPISIRELFGSPIVADVAALIDTHLSSAEAVPDDPIVPVEREYISHSEEAL